MKVQKIRQFFLVVRCLIVHAAPRWEALVLWRRTSCRRSWVWTLWVLGSGTRKSGPPNLFC